MNAYNFCNKKKGKGMEKKPISRAGFDSLIKELKDLKEKLSNKNNYIKRRIFNTTPH